MKSGELDIVVYDFETGGVIPGHSEAIQVAAVAYNGRTLEPYPKEQGGEFQSLMKPIHFDRLEPKALEVNHITEEELRSAPDQKLVWNNFVEWVKRYNPKKTKWTAPIAGGKNIRRFDNAFAFHLNVLHCPKKENTVLFSERRELDLEDEIYRWFSFDDELNDEKMDTLRDYFGMSKEGAHDALVDARQTGDLIMKFLKLYRLLKKKTVTKDGVTRPFVPLKGAFLNVQSA